VVAANNMIRKIKKNELSKLLALYKHLHKNDSPLPCQKEIKIIWQEIIKNKNIHYFVLDIKGELVASCHLVIIPNLTRSCKPYGIIENVVTREKFRNKGFGKEILQYALNFAWENNCYKVMLMTGSKKEWVYNFYKNAGFKKDIKTAFIANPENKTKNGS
jgi:GNAT superfamily N-acetyltransferase